MISISHWCRDADHGKPIDNITGFKTIVRFGSLEIRKQIIPPSHYMRLDINTRDVLQPKEAYCDKGYRGSETIEGTTIQLTNRKKKSVSRREWKWFKRRSAIEPIFGHLKSDNKLERNHLKGKEGDRINAILAGCGFNMRKLIRAFFLLILYWLKFGRDTEMNSHSFTKIVTPVS